MEDFLFQSQLGIDVGSLEAKGGNVPLGAAALRQPRHNLAHRDGKLESVTREARRDNNVCVARQRVDYKVAVVRVVVHARLALDAPSQAAK